MPALPLPNEVGNLDTYKERGSESSFKRASYLWVATKPCEVSCGATIRQRTAATNSIDVFGRGNRFTYFM